MAKNNFRINAPADLAGGVYADFASVWHTKNVFVLDFASLTAPPKKDQNDQGEEVLNLNAQIVSRVKIPPEQVFEIMKALEKQLTAWEKETGRK